MTTAPPAPGRLTGTGTLDALVGDESRFLDEHWTRTPMLRTAAAPDRFRSVLTMDDIAGLLSSGALRLPHVRLVRDGLPVAESLFTRVRPIGHGTVTDAVDPAKLLSMFRIGATVVLDAVELLFPAVRDLCDRLADRLNCPVDAVAFLTPPDRKGLSPHIDDEDVFVLQLSGTKQWTVHEQLRPVPLTPGALPKDRLGPVALTPLLRPGDVMYVPRGTPHHAVSTGGHSLHLSLAARRPTLDARTTDAFRDALAAAGPDEDLDSLLAPDELLGRMLQRATSALRHISLPSDRARPEPADGSSLHSALLGLDALGRDGAHFTATGEVQLSDEDGGRVLADFGGFQARFPEAARPVLARLSAGLDVGTDEFGADATGALGQLLLRGAVRLTN